MLDSKNFNNIITILIVFSRVGLRLCEVQYIEYLIDMGGEY